MKYGLFALGAIYILAVVLSLSGNLYALPEYSVRYGQSCQLCHQSASGGGMRNLYGAQFYSYTELPSHPVDFNDLGKINPKITDQLQLGTDLRTLYYAQHSSVAGNDANSFITMQGDLYLAFTPSDHTVAVVDKKISGNYEAFFQAEGLLGDWSVKAGRFMPNYGWHFVDHKAFVRQFTIFGGAYGIGGLEDGIEVGHYNEHGDLSVTLTNGEPPSIFDNNKGKAAVVRLDRRFHLGKANMTFGGSYRYADLGQKPGPYTRYGGLFWGLGGGPFTYLGEVDGITVTDSTSLVSTHLVRYQVKQGWYATGGFDYYDTNTSVQSGTTWRARLGCDYVPYGYMAISPAFDYNHDSDGTNYVTGELQLHVWF